MNKLIYLILFYASLSVGGERMNVVIDQVLDKDNYAKEEWQARGLNPSPQAKIQVLEAVTKSFLTELKSVHSRYDNDKVQLSAAVNRLVDELPWSELDTEEKEFLADVLAPAIRSVGLNPWLIF
ncbi:hypothetical protein A3767_00130 [Oleiphilus sp. HI0133]|nr:hypothetical protein A3767_00130 [Oleiphilus sp. HI0133]